MNTKETTRGLAAHARASTKIPQRGTRKLRALDVYELLWERRGGISLEDVTSRYSVSKPTASRVLSELLDRPSLGVERIVDDRRVTFRLSNARRTRLSSEQRWALAVAREVLVGLNGTAVVDAIDVALDADDDAPLSIQGPPSMEDPVVASILFEARVRQRRVECGYRGARDPEIRKRIVEVHDLRLYGGAWYATVADVEANGIPKSFKVSRVAWATLGQERNTHTIDVERLYEHSVGIWHGEIVDVAVRVDGDAARLAREYPPNITAQFENDGDAVIVRARVAGLEEIARWTWRWGKNALVLAPRLLVERVGADLKAASDRYDFGPVKS